MNPDQNTPSFASFHCKSTVMVQGNSSLPSPMTGGTSFHNPPQFITHVTPKPQYRDALRRWAKMISKFSEAESKVKGVQNSAGYLIFLHCDSSAQEALQNAENIGKLSLDGYPDDDRNRLLVEKVLAVIVKDIPSECVKKEVELLSKIYTCYRLTNETACDFVTDFPQQWQRTPIKRNRLIHQ